MKILRIALHSFLLTLINIFAILFGFGIYLFVRPANQIAVQVPVALVVSVAGCLAWWATSHRLPVRWVALHKREELLWVYLAALLWNPAIFIPLHYGTQGYLTSFGNILYFWLFQIPANLAAILPVLIINKHKSGQQIATTPGS
jgi:hypothetical protein